MPITEITTVVVDGITIGLSDTIYNLIQAGEFTIANLQPYMIVGQSTIGEQKYASLSAGERNYTGVGGDTPAWFPANNTGRLGPPTVEFQTKDGVSLPHDAYGRNFLVHGTLNAGGEPQSICNDNMSTSDLRVVTSIDFKKIYYDVEMSSWTYNYGPPNGTATVYSTGSLGKVKTIDNDEDTSCFVYSIFGDDSDWYCVKDWMFPADDSAQFGWHMSCEQSISGSFSNTYSSLGAGYENYAHNKTMFRWMGNQIGGVYGGGDMNWNYGGEPAIINGDIIQICSYSPYGGNCKFIITGLDNALKQLANAGLKFKWNNTWYKPISDGGIVTGYTDDMTEESEWDDIVDVTNNVVPVTPIPPVPPTPSDDDLDDHKMGAGTGISGMANLWLLTKSQLNDLHGAFNSAPGGFDPMNSLISVMGLGVAPIYLFNDIEVITPINIRKSDGTSWSTGVEGHIVDAQKSAFQFTEITVNRKYNNFLDFSPYAIHEIFIPMCGWLTLPDIAVDRSITVTYLPDVESLKCRAVVSVVDNSGNRCVIGEKDGIMGADVPFTNTGHSLYVGEAIINGMNVAGEVITGAIGAGFTKTNAKGGTYRPYEGFTVGMAGTLPGAIGNALVSGQTNRTHYMTGNGTRIGFSDGENIQIKSTYHNIDKPRNYDHTVGKVCNKTGELSDFKGFTVCDNPHITFSALESEKEEIKRLLEEGVIL